MCGLNMRIIGIGISSVSTGSIILNTRGLNHIPKKSATYISVSGVWIIRIFLLMLCFLV